MLIGGLAFPIAVPMVFSVLFPSSFRASHPTVTTSASIVSSASVTACAIATTSAAVSAVGIFIHWRCFAGEYLMEVRWSCKRRV